MVYEVSEAQYIWKVHGRGVLETGRRIVQSSLMRDAPVYLPHNSLKSIFFHFPQAEFYSTPLFTLSLLPIA